MKYTGALIAVKDMEASKRFYHDLLGLEVVDDFGACAVLTGGLALQTLETWEGFIQKKRSEIVFGNNAAELGFEVEDIDAFIKKLASFSPVSYVHPPIEHRWGQRVVRFYDPDGHIIEVGENLDVVVRRFIDSGLSAGQTAVRMDVAVDFIESSLKRRAVVLTS